MANKLNQWSTYQTPTNQKISLWRRSHLDSTLLLGLSALVACGLIILFSASNGDYDIVERQLVRIGFAAVGMLLFAQISPDKYRLWTPWLYGVTIVLLLAVLAIGHIGKGAQRWLNLGVVHFQPSEVMKLALPMMLAWYFREKQLPPTTFQLLIASFLILLPVGLIAVQPDLGTAVLVAAAGASVMLLAGIRFKMLVILLTIVVVATPFLWHHLHDYQRQRVLTFINPERDPLGSGYHIIQSKIAIGSGGLYGKGWLKGSQSHLQFLPEHTTDFIFAVCGEEFGLVGGVILISLFAWLVARALIIASSASDTYCRLLAGSFALALFFAVFINIGMVTGILPVVGVPLPLVSYGGSSIVTIFASLGILMSINFHRKLVST